MKAAIYCRLSEEDRNKRSETDDSNSIQNQKAMLLQYAMDRNWDVYNIYSDDDYTGSDRRRPEFNRLLKDAQAHRFDIVLCKTQSRFTRELELVEKYIHGLFPLWGIRFVSIVDNADTANKGNKKSRQINGLVNEWYLEDMSENIKSVLTSRREQGYHIGAFALYGYKKDPEAKGRLIIDDEAALIVREVFELYAEGCGKSAIARLLNDRGVPNPTEYKRLQGLRYQQAKAKNSTLWRYSAISDMLTNEIYIGNMVQGKYGSVSYKTKQNKPRPRSEWYIVKNTHEPIIDLGLWERAQARIRDRAKPCYTGKIGVFAGKVKCMYCGYTMRSCKNHGRYYLKCATRNVSEDSCEGSFIPQETLEQIVVAEINLLSETYLDKDELEKSVEFDRSIQYQKTQIAADIRIHEKKLADCSEGIKDLYMDKVRKIVSEGDFEPLLKALNEERLRIELAVSDEKKRLEEIEEKISLGDDRRELIDRYVDLTSLSREVIEVLIDHIAVGRRTPGTHDYPVEIHWNI